MSRKTRKLIWSVPLVAAVAVIGALALFVTLTPGSLFADDLADSPQNIEVKAADGNSGRTNLVLTWEAPAAGAPDMYRIDVSSNGDRWSPETEVSGSTLTYTDDLTSAVDAEIDKNADAPVSVTRYYRVFADNSHGSGQVSTTESASTKNVSTPTAVDAFGARASGPEAINLTWTVPDDGGSDILGYCIRAWSTDAGDNEASVASVSDTNCKDLFFSQGPGISNADGVADVENTVNDSGLVIRAATGSSYTHKNLRAGQTWNYTAYALNKYGHSKTASNTRQVKTASANNPPSPGNLLIRQVASDSAVIVQLYWTVTGDGGQNITAYRVEVTDTPNNWSPDGTELPGEATGVTRGSGTPLAFPVTTPPTESGKRVAVINVTPEVAEVDPVSHNLRHTVTVAANSGDMPTTVYYRVRVETGSGNGAKMSAYTEGSIRVTVPDNTVQPVVVYEHSARNPNDPVVVADTDPDVSDDTVPGEIKLTVTRSTEGGSSDYRVDISDDDGATWTMVHRSTRPINETEYQHQNLKPDTERHFRLFTKNGSNFGLASDVVPDTSGNSKPPERVENLMAVNNGAGEVKVSWTAPLKDNGAMVDKYCVVMNQIDDNNDVTGGTAVTRTSIRTVAESDDDGDEANCTRYGLPDLYPGKDSISGSNRIIDVDADLTMITAKVDQETRWQFEVYALNGATDPSAGGPDPDTKKGLATTSETVHDKTTAGMTPNVPRDLTVELARDTNLSGVGNRGVLLLWNQPASVPGASVNSYKIERSKDGGDYEVLVSSQSATRTYYVDTSEPAADETRTYRITAINIAGAGTEMATVMIPYPAADHTHEPVVTELTAPPSVTVSSLRDTVSVTWDPASIENAEQVKVVLFDSGVTKIVDLKTFNAANDPGAATFTGVDSGTYKVTVASFRTGDRHKLSALMEVTVE